MHTTSHTWALSHCWCCSLYNLLLFLFLLHYIVFVLFVFLLKERKKEKSYNSSTQKTLKLKDKNKPFFLKGILINEQKL